MTSLTTSPLDVGRVLELHFDPFTSRISIRSEYELTVEIVAGDNVGFSDTADYEAVVLRDGLVVLSWKEHNGSTIVSILDFESDTTYTAVTPATGEFMRLNGRIELKPPT